MAKPGIQTKNFDDLFSKTGMAWLLLFRVAFWPALANHARKSQIDRRYFKCQNYGKFAYFRIIGSHYFIKIIMQYAYFKLKLSYIRTIFVWNFRLVPKLYGAKGSSIFSSDLNKKKLTLEFVLARVTEVTSRSVPTPFVAAGQISVPTDSWIYWRPARRIYWENLHNQTASLYTCTA